MTLLARLPSNISKGATGGLGFSTVVVQAAAGQEQRLANWTRPRGKWNIAYGVRNKTDLQNVMALHMASYGKLYPFLFKDWSDFEATQEPFDTGDGSKTVFQLSKTYKAIADDLSVVRFYTRNIDAPVLSTVQIFVNGVLKNLGTDYTITDAGVVTFTSAPANTLVLSWTGQFDVICRFDIDMPNIEMQLATVGQITNLPIIELLDER